jgi:hypothetical protein
MSRMGLLACVFIGQALLASPARAQDAPPEDERFSLYRTEDGYLRLDGRTGQLSSCSSREARWVCLTLPEERNALESEIARLQADNAALKKELLTHQLPLPQGVRPDPPHAAAPQSSGRADHKFERVGSVIKNVWQRVIAFVVNMQRDLLKRS